MRTLFCYWTWQDRYQQRVDLALKGCARAEKALQIATDELESVTKDLVLAREQRRKAVEDQNQQKQSTWEQNVKKAAEDVDKAKKDVDKAKEDFHKAEERLKEEEAKVSAAPAQAAGGVQLLLWLLVCSIPHGRRAFRAFLFFGVMLCSSKDQLVVKFHFVGWQHFGERVELSEQRAVGCFRFHANLVALRVLLMLLNLLSVLGSRWGGGQPVFRSLCALQVAVVFV